MDSSYLIPMLFLLIMTMLYLRKINAMLDSQPADALALSPKRWTTDFIRHNYEQRMKEPIDVKLSLPPRTGNRYIVVGGSGFLGGWIVIHLLQRYESPANIRVIDLRLPTRRDLTTGSASGVDFRQADISDPKQVAAAFDAPWPHSTEQAPLTIIHTAANIRFYERALSLVGRSSKVNVDGVKNVLDNAKKHDARCFVFTSSGAVGIKKCKYWLWPWEREPKNFVQVLKDDDSSAPKLHGDFFSNYAYTKKLAETLVAQADRSVTTNGSVLRTGCIRPGNGVYGPGGDINVGAYVVRKVNPSWVSNSIQSECYVENASLAHLLYEQRLLELNDSESKYPDIGGQAFVVTDPNPPITYGDIYLSLHTLTDGEVVFPRLPPVLMLLFAHAIEAYYLSRIWLTSLPLVGNGWAKLLPQVGGDIVNLQPSLFPLTSVHVLFDDSRARSNPEDEGLGYSAPFTSLDGICKVVSEHKASGGVVEERQRTGGGISFTFSLTWAEKGVGRAAAEIGVVENGTANLTRS